MKTNAVSSQMCKLEMISQVEGGKEAAEDGKGEGMGREGNRQVAVVSLAFWFRCCGADCCLRNGSGVQKKIPRNAELRNVPSPTHTTHTPRKSKGMCSRHKIASG